MKPGLFALALTLLLSACGFHLRGFVAVPKYLNDVAILVQNGNMDLVSALKAQLEGYKVRVSPNPEQAQYWLNIHHIDKKKNIVSIGSSTNPRQYQLTLRIIFSLQTPNGRILVPRTQVQSNRQFTSNNDRILGSNLEEHTLINEMRKDAAVQILNRISSLHHAN